MIVYWIILPWQKHHTRHSHGAHLQSHTSEHGLTFRHCHRRGNLSEGCQVKEEYESQRGRFRGCQAPEEVVAILQWRRFKVGFAGWVSGSWKAFRRCCFLWYGCGVGRIGGGFTATEEQREGVVCRRENSSTVRCWWKIVHRGKSL